MNIKQTYALSDLIECDTAAIINDIKVSGNLDIDGVMQEILLSKSPYLQIGIDEVGRGTLLGDVVISAVMLPTSLTGALSELDLSATPLAGLNDSKKLSETKRNLIYHQLHQHAIARICVHVPPQIIDSINILQATLQGMRVAVFCLLQNISTHSEVTQHLSKLNLEILFDGNKMPNLDFERYQEWGYEVAKINASTVVKGDGKFSSIAAAAVMAKVTRDSEMYQLASEYPQYHIDKHKGYPTVAHLSALQEFGVIDNVYRKSFKPVKKILDES